MASTPREAGPKDTRAKGVVRTAMSSKLKHLMGLHGMTQNDLAERVGVVQSRIAKWLKGIGEPHSVHLLKISQVFGVSLLYLCDPSIPIRAHGDCPLEHDETIDEDTVLLMQLVERIGADVVLARLMNVGDPAPREGGPKYRQPASTRILPGKRGIAPASLPKSPLGKDKPPKGSR